MPKIETRCQRCGGIIDSGKPNLSFRCVTCGRTICQCSANETIEEDDTEETSQ
jgi:predicted RNA-binding Zn-ribbon protein involved in translation (DUF1610 family)